MWADDYKLLSSRDFRGWGGSLKFCENICLDQISTSMCMLVELPFKNLTWKGNKALSLTGDCSSRTNISSGGRCRCSCTLQDFKRILVCAQWQITERIFFITCDVTLLFYFLISLPFPEVCRNPPAFSSLLLIHPTSHSSVWVSSLKCIIFFYRQVRQDVLSAHPSLARHSFHSVRGNVEESKKSNRQIDKTSRHTRLKRNKLTAAYQKRRPQSDAWNTTLRSCTETRCLRGNLF